MSHPLFASQRPDNQINHRRCSHPPVGHTLHTQPHFLPRIFWKPSWIQAGCLPAPTTNTQFISGWNGPNCARVLSRWHGTKIEDCDAHAKRAPSVSAFSFLLARVTMKMSHLKRTIDWCFKLTHSFRIVVFLSPFFFTISHYSSHRISLILCVKMNKKERW